MDYIQLLGNAAHRLEIALHRLHAMTAGLTLLGPTVAALFQTPEHGLLIIETTLHYLHYYAAVGLACHGIIFVVRSLLDTAENAKSDWNDRNDE